MDPICLATLWLYEWVRRLTAVLPCTETSVKTFSLEFVMLMRTYYSFLMSYRNTLGLMQTLTWERQHWDWLFNNFPNFINLFTKCWLDFLLHIMFFLAHCFSFCLQCSSPRCHWTYLFRWFWLYSGLLVSVSPLLHLVMVFFSSVYSLCYHCWTLLPSAEINTLFTLHRQKQSEWRTGFCGIRPKVTCLLILF